MKHLSDKQIQELLEKDSLLSGPGREHLKSCPACRRQLELYRTMELELKSGERVGNLPESFADSVLRQLPVHAKTIRFELKDVLLFGIPWVVAFTLFFILVDTKPVLELFSGFQLPAFSFEPFYRIMKPVINLVQQRITVYISVALVMVIVTTLDHFLLRTKWQR